MNSIHLRRVLVLAVKCVLTFLLFWALAHLLGCASTVQPSVTCDAFRQSVCAREFGCGNTAADSPQQKQAALDLCERTTVVDCMVEPDVDACLDALQASACDAPEPAACKAVLTTK